MCLNEPKKRNISFQCKYKWFSFYQFWMFLVFYQAKIKDSTLQEPVKAHVTFQVTPTKQDNKPEKNKPYAGNAVRRSKTLLQMDFLNAQNRQEAYSQWITTRPQE